MNIERAREILYLGSRWSNWSEHCTGKEHEEVMEKWKSMPGHTCWYDALVRLAYPEREVVKL